MTTALTDEEIAQRVTYILQRRWSEGRYVLWVDDGESRSYLNACLEPEAQLAPDPDGLSDHERAGTRPGPLLAAGTWEACEAASRLLLEES